MPVQPTYPIYVPSKGRADYAYTARLFMKDGLPFRMVVEPQDGDAYAEVVGRDRLLFLPESNRGLVFARNWIKEHSIAEGHKRHWQFDDDIEGMTRLYRNKKILCSPRIAIYAAETFIDRYENVGLASFNSEFFLPTHGRWTFQHPPYHLNARCYTCFVMDNSLPYRWRYRYNEDTDMTLQVLTGGHCTILFNAFMIRTKETMSTGGGQTDIYVDDGRLQMARQLERVWPKIVTTKRKFGRPQHRVAHDWKKFDTPLIRRTDIDWEELARKGNDEFGASLQQIRPSKSEEFQQWIDRNK